MPIKNKLLHILPIALVLMIGIWFDDVQGVRFFTLFGLCGLIVLQHVFRVFFHEDRRVFMTFVLEILLLVILEMQSRYVVNYFFHIAYLTLLIDMTFGVAGVKWYLLAGAAVAASMLKYVYLLSISLSVGNIAQTAFLGLVGISLIVALSLFKEIDAQRSEKEVLYQELLKAHKQLKAYSDQVKELAALEERTRLAREIHDTLGHDLIATVMSLEMAQRKSEDDELKAILQQAKTSVKKGLSDIRQVVSALRLPSERLGVKEIENLISEFESKSDWTIIRTIDVPEEDLNEQTVTTLFRVVQESLTNIAKHAHASFVQIIIIKEEAGIVFSIADNGIGAQDSGEGYGLKGITERVEALSGAVKFETDKGFTVKGILPLGGDHD
ncbi:MULTISPECIES: sensor histidine kinase [unclassified Fusibacter]|uniref:sensor histidine kinase n=1 Tax=unclassified Fusibacter TaxID=2624464 RepID=UPI0013E91021|nr:MULTISPECIES: sensor histidine kinase [unclassified Fusibacter]MCK8059795.1 sensor histidine kinase [Fusibacter sp. A2]NPE21596.1 sensor histidine kinase [Fusibacter sp. A1]